MIGVSNLTLHYFKIPKLSAVILLFLLICIDKLIKDISPIYYKRYVDYTFAIFADDKDRKAFLSKLNIMHANLEFTMEIAIKNKLVF